MNSIEVHGLTKRFGDTLAVDDISLSVRPGEILGFLGANGSGKTTTIRMICGLLTPTSGQGTVLGHDLFRDSHRIKPQVGYMTQKFSLYDDLTVHENLWFAGLVYGVPDLRRRVADTLDGLGMTGRAGQKAGTLSGGWKQRLALATCTLHDPRILLLDEPTAGVDPGARRAFWDRIADIAATGVTVLVSTHYMDEAERCDRIAMVHRGRIVAAGTADEIARNSGLATYVVQGDDLAELTPRLRAVPGVVQVARFGASLHIVGPESADLPDRIAAALGGTGRMTRARTSIEDMFIRMIDPSASMSASVPASASTSAPSNAAAGANPSSASGQDSGQASGQTSGEQAA